MTIMAHDVYAGVADDDDDDEDDEDDDDRIAIFILLTVARIAPCI